MNNVFLKVPVDAYALIKETLEADSVSRAFEPELRHRIGASIESIEEYDCPSMMDEELGCLLEDLYHQLSTDESLDHIPGAAKYHRLLAQLKTIMVRRGSPQVG